MTYTIQPHWIPQPNVNIWTQPMIVKTIAPKINLAESFKPKRAGTKTAHVIFILDDSGSMQSCRDSTISGYNEFLQKQKYDAETSKIQTFVSLYKFDGTNVICSQNKISVFDAKPLTRYTYNPQGTTNLYDAIGGVILDINKTLESTSKADRDSIIITILTDGAENSSKTFNQTSIKQMIEKAEGKDWAFIFLGANIDAYAVGASMGFTDNNTLQYNTSNMFQTMSVASNMTNRLKASRASGMDTNTAYASSAFTDSERDDVK